MPMLSLRNQSANAHRLAFAEGNLRLIREKCQKFLPRTHKILCADLARWMASDDRKGFHAAGWTFLSAGSRDSQDLRIPKNHRGPRRFPGRARLRSSPDSLPPRRDSRVRRKPHPPTLAAAWPRSAERQSQGCIKLSILSLRPARRSAGGGTSGERTEERGNQ